MYDVNLSWHNNVQAGERPTPFVLIQTSMGYRAYGAKEVHDLLDTSNDYLSSESRIKSFGSFERIINSPDDDLLAAYSAKLQGQASITFLNEDHHFTDLLKTEPLLGKQLEIWLAFPDSTTGGTETAFEDTSETEWTDTIETTWEDTTTASTGSTRLQIFSGLIKNYRQSGVDLFEIDAEEDYGDSLNRVHYLERSDQFDNPLNTGDRLPIVYGDLTDGSRGNWVLPCIDTENRVYCYAAHAVQSTTNGNVVSVYVGDDLDAGSFNDSNATYGGFATVEFSFNGDKLNAQCATFDVMTKGDSGDGETTLVTFDGQSCWRMDGGGDNPASYAWVYTTVSQYYGYLPSGKATIEAKLWHATLGAQASLDYFSFYTYLIKENTAGEGCYFEVEFASDGMYIYDTGVSSDSYQANTLVSIATWQTWTFYIDFSDPTNSTCDIALNGSIVQRSQPCTTDGLISGGVAGNTFVAQYGVNTKNTTTYVDYFKIDEGFRLDKGNTIVSARGKGKSSGATLTENVVEIMDDYLSNEVGWSGSFESTEKAIAESLFDGESYKSAGVITSDRNIWEVIQEMAGSFLGNVFLNGSGELILKLDIGSRQYAVADIAPKGEINLVTSEQRLISIINQFPANYAYNYAYNEYNKYDTGSTTLDAISQDVYDVRKPSDTYALNWVRDATTAQSLQSLIVSRLKDPIWIISCKDFTPKRLHVDIGDNLALTFDNLYSPVFGEQLINQIFKIVGVQPSFDAGIVNFTVLDTGFWLTWPETANGSYGHSKDYTGPGYSPLGSGTLIADGSIRAGSNRDTTTY